MSYVFPKPKPQAADYAHCSYNAAGDFKCGKEGFTCYDAPGAKTGSDSVFPLGEYFTFSGAPIEVNYPTKISNQSCATRLMDAAAQAPKN